MRPDDTPEEIQRKLDRVANPCPFACACMGPAPGDPLCRCAMGSVVRFNGKFIKLTLLEPEQHQYQWNQDGSSKWGKEVVITDGGDDLVGVMGALRKLTPFSIKECRDVLRKLPFVLKSDASDHEAGIFKTLLEAAGAKVELR
jgi:ribosomal protein L7/L12